MESGRPSAPLLGCGSTRRVASGAPVGNPLGRGHGAEVPAPPEQRDAYSDAVSGDGVLLIRLHTRNGDSLLPPTIRVVVLSWNVDLGSDVVITGVSSDFAGSWMNGSAPIAVGDVFTGATATSGWSNLSNTIAAVPSATCKFRIALAAAAVPLPGAAGLAACGLLSAGRRRRR